MDDIVKALKMAMTWQRVLFSGAIFSAVPHTSMKSEPRLGDQKAVAQGFWKPFFELRRRPKQSCPLPRVCLGQANYPAWWRQHL